jgi:hypothetical protein
MKFSKRITLKEYINLIYILTYKKGWMIFITIIGLLMLLITIIYLTGTAPILFDKDFNPRADIFMAFLFLVAIPVSIYFTAKSNYSSTKRLQEQIDYELSDQTIRISGESFNAVLNLNKAYKIEELKNWFLIYESKRTANFIDKRELSAEQIQDLRSFFKTFKTVKLDLK